MASKLKLEKLTENYQKSTTYGKKIELELAEVAEQLLQTRLQMTKLEQQIREAGSQSNQLECTLKKLQEENSAYQYKMQKIQIRQQEYTKKVTIQESMLEKKINHQNQLQAKIQELESFLQSRASLDSEIANTKQAVQIIESKLTNQAGQIESICSNLLVLNKKTRGKEDELQRKEKVILKKKSILQNLKQKIEEDEEKDKENDCYNNKETRQENRITSLRVKRTQANNILQSKIQQIMCFYSAIEQFCENATAIKNNLQKTDEIANQFKLKKASLIRLSSMLKIEQSNNLCN